MANQKLAKAARVKAAARLNAQKARAAEKFRLQKQRLRERKALEVKRKRMVKEKERVRRMKLKEAVKAKVAREKEKARKALLAARVKAAKEKERARLKIAKDKERARLQATKEKEHLRKVVAQQKARERAEKEKARLKAAKEKQKERERIAREKAKAKEIAAREKAKAKELAALEKAKAKEAALLAKQKEKELKAQLKQQAQELMKLRKAGRPRRNGDAERALLLRAESRPEDAEARRTRLKNLIKLGKERGFLTYAEINDHLPDDMVDAEQIESIISTFNDMGIQVYDEAPDADALLISETAPAGVPDEDAEEEAEAALSTVDPEFGRTTDPVRMYMREMGSVELLTREGEIEIAKRIEDGLKHMIQAISACPTTIAEILDLSGKVGRDEMRIDELVDGLIDPNAKDEPIQELADDVEPEEEEETEGEDESAALSASLLQLKEDALARFAKIARLYEKMKKALVEHGHRSKEYIRVRDQIGNELMNIRFTARIIERLCDSLRGMVEEVRGHEREIMNLCVNKGGMLRPHFIKEFPGSETNMRWVKNEIAAAKPWSGQLARFEPNILEQQQKLLAIQKRIGIPLEGPQGDQQADVDRRGEGATREARDDRGQPAPCNLDREEVHQPRPAVPRPDPGRQHRPDEGGGQVRVPPRVQVLDLRHLVDQAGDHALDRRPGAHHPHPGTHDRDHQQDEPDHAGRSCRRPVRSRTRRRLPRRWRCQRTRSARSSRSPRSRSRWRRPSATTTTRTLATSSRIRRRSRRTTPPCMPPCAKSPRTCWTRSPRARPRCCACASESR